MSLENEMQLEQDYLMPTFGRYPVQFVAGKGMRLIDSNGKVYLDFLSGIGVCSLGHCHPVLVEELRKQAGELMHVGNYFYIGKRGEVASKLSDMLSRSYIDADAGANAAGSNDGSNAAGASANDSELTYQGSWKTFFANSGAEANECAIKLARIHHSKRAGAEVQSQTPLVVTLVDGFHGRTLASLASTGQPRLHHGFEPMPEGFVYVPINDVDAIRALFAERGSQICAVMLECVQGESGVHPCDGAYLREVRRLCTASGALMICDEVQSGIYRTGRPFAFQHFGFTPDVVTMAKGIASGFPMGACSARAGIADDMTPGTHGSTFGGSSLAMACALATLAELDSHATEERVSRVGKHLRARLAELPQVTQTRGFGLMCAAELADGIDAHDVVAEALLQGAVANAPRDTTLRFLPPLVCTEQDADEFVGILGAALAKLNQ